MPDKQIMARIGSAFSILNRPSLSVSSLVSADWVHYVHSLVHENTQCLASDVATTAHWTAFLAEYRRRCEAAAGRVGEPLRGPFMKVPPPEKVASCNDVLGSAIAPGQLFLRSRTGAA